MVRVVHIMIDTSGSMNDMGKKHLLRNLCRYIRQRQSILFEQDINYQFYLWKDDFVKVELNDYDDFPAINASGKSLLIHNREPCLSNFIFEKRNTITDLNLILLSDGCFSWHDFESFVSWKQKKSALLATLRLTAIAIGADADLEKLTKIATNNNIYLAEDIALALQHACIGNTSITQPFTAPVSIEDLNVKDHHTLTHISISDVEEDWDA